MEKCYVIGSRALGDTICATPLLRKLHKSYGEKIHVFTFQPLVFESNPYAASVSEIKKDLNELINDLKNQYEVFSSFIDIQPEGKPERKHNTYDIRQYHATELGMMLLPQELDCDYFPNQNFNIQLPEKYVCIHSASTWPSRTWSQDKFQELTNKLNDLGIAVVSIGKNSSETGFWGKQNKNTYNIEIKRGLNLVNKLSLNECWHVINRSNLFVTMDSGLLHLAGTTETFILQLGSSIHPSLRAPYRNGKQAYNHIYVKGPCDLFCGSDVKYGIPEWGTIHGVPPIGNCLEKKSTFECHPSVDQVYEVCEKILSSLKIEMSKELAIENKTKVLLVAEHLSTGGMPEVFRKRVETLLNLGCDVFVVEFSFYSGAFVVQRDKIIKMLPENRFISLGFLNEPSEEYLIKRLKLMDIIEDFKPEYVHLEEVPEKYCYGGFPDELAKRLYHKDRFYKIFETSHDSGFDPVQNKKYLPDKFIWISKWHLEKYKDFKIPQVVIEYPIEKKDRPNREESLKALDLDPSFKHVLNVGLFTPRKNQSEIFEYAEKLKEEKIQFHFVGNLAGNFEYYWKPLMDNPPSNCKVWGERNDVENFYKAMDLFCFTSKGHATDRETNPIVIKEAISWDMKLALRNLEVYMGAYENDPNIKFLTEDIDENCQLIKSQLGLNDNKKKFFINESNQRLPKKVVITHANEQYLKTAESLVKSFLEFSKTPVVLYTLNCEADFDYPNLIKIPFSTNFKQQPKLVYDSKGDYFKDGDDEYSYLTLTQKASVILDALNRGIEVGCYIDSDMICNNNFDSIFDYQGEIEDYPIATEGPFQYMLYKGKTNLEDPLMKLLDVPAENRTWYRQTNTILFNQNCKKFISEWQSVCESEDIIKDWRNLAPYHEETILNVLLWKNKKNKYLPQTFLNTVNVDTIKYFKNHNEDKDWNDNMGRFQIPIHENEGADRGWICFKKNKNHVKLFHGMKDPKKMNVCIEYLKNE